MDWSHTQTAAAIRTIVERSAAAQLVSVDAANLFYVTLLNAYTLLFRNGVLVVIEHLNH